MPQFLPDSRSTTQPDIDACRTLLASGSRTFHAASFLLPRRVRDPATALYAFCRVADDAVDLGDASPRVLDELQQRLDLAYAGTPAPYAADRAFADTVCRFDIPKALPEALIEGFAWDRQNRRYQTISDLQAYGARVAGTVGAMMALLLGARDASRLARACDLGIAMQLTNIARDVGEDARAGRLYLPLDWMHDAGMDPDKWLADPHFSPAIASVIERLLDVAERLYERSEVGIAGLPASCRPGIFAARFLYAGIGHEVARNGYDSISRRARMPAHRKLATLANISGASALSILRTPQTSVTVLEQAMFLVTAAAKPSTQGALYLRNQPRVPWWDLYGGAVKAIELFEQLERRERQQRTRSRFDLDELAASGVTGS
jgi:phytoene synthase